MSLTCGFFNSMNHDRKYDATVFGDIFNGIINDGVFMNIGTAMQVTANNGMYVNVGIGRAWFNGTWTLNDTLMLVKIEDAELILDRIDAIVLEVNKSDDVRANTIKVIKGTPSSSPIKPTMQKDLYVNQYPLAYITVRANTTNITQSMIENRVGTDDCPFVTGILQTISAESLLRQWEAEYNEWAAGNQSSFENWFQHLRNELDENQAAHLQRQIDDLLDDVDDKIQEFETDFRNLYSGTLLAGETSLTITNPGIKADGLIDIYTSVYGVVPKGVTVGNGFIILSFTSLTVDLIVKVRCI